MYPYEQISQRLFEIIEIEEREHLINFFVVFSRFEYALKKANFLKNPNGNAEADWDNFALAIQVAFDTSKTTKPELQTAVTFLTNDQPKKQMARSNNITWETTNPDANAMKWLLILVRRVRNNLFHGGKFRRIIETSDNRQRDFLLIRYSLIILYECLEQHSDVRRHFLSGLE